MDTSATWRVVCAWCLQPTDGLGPVLADDVVSHDICPACLQKERERMVPHEAGLL